jgi:hypothetical protein
MSPEKRMLRDSLQPDEAGWGDFEARFLAQTAQCPPLTDVFALADSKIALSDSLAIARDPRLLHIASCELCRPWFESHQTRGTTEPESPDEPPRPGSLLAALAVTPELDPVWSQTDPRTSEIVGLLRDGNIYQVLKRLHGLLAGVLEEYGSNPARVESFREFLAEHLRQDPSADQRFHELTLAFIRQQGQLDKLPSLPTVDRVTRNVFRGAIRGIQRRIKPADPRHQFLQDALEEEVESVQGVREMYNLNQGSAAALDPGDLESLCSKIENVTGSFTTVFRPN